MKKINKNEYLVENIKNKKDIVDYISRFMFFFCIAVIVGLFIYALIQ